MAFPPQAALILEDGFESGTMDKWRDAGAGTLAVTTEQARSGRYFLHFEHSD